MFKFEKKHILIILISGAALRIAVYALMPPTLYPDSYKYMAQAEMFHRFDLSGYSGLAPGYSLVIAAFGGNIQALTLFQAGIGLVTSLLLYFIFGLLSGSSRIGLAGALVYALSPFQAVFERDVLTESLTTFLTALTVYHLIRIHSGQDRPHNWLFMGLSASLAAALRPVMQFLPPLAALLAVLAYYMQNRKKSLSNAAWRTVLAVLPAVIIIGGWSAFNYHRFNYFSLTILTGFHLTNHSGAFMEKAPPEYADIAAIYLKHRQEMIALTGRHGNTIWRALPELEAVTGLSRAELSKRFTSLSVRLILDNPLPYLRQAAKGFIIFWLPCWYNGEQGLLPALRSGDLAERLLLWPCTLAQALLTAVFMGLPFALALNRKMRDQVKPNLGLIALYAIVTATAVLSTLTEFGSNDRFEQPVEPYVLGIGLYVLLRLFFPDKERIQATR